MRWRVFRSLLTNPQQIHSIHINMHVSTVSKGSRLARVLASTQGRNQRHCINVCSSPVHHKHGMCYAQCSGWQAKARATVAPRSPFQRVPVSTHCCRGHVLVHAKMTGRTGGAKVRSWGRYVSMCHQTTRSINIASHPSLVPERRAKVEYTMAIVVSAASGGYARGPHVRTHAQPTLWLEWRIC